MEKINKLRSLVSSFRPNTEEQALIYLKNMVSEFGKVVMDIEPFSFCLYFNENKDLIYERCGGKIKDVVDTSHSISILDIVKLYRDDLKLYD